MFKSNVGFGVFEQSSRRYYVSELFEKSLASVRFVLKKVILISIAVVFLLVGLVYLELTSPEDRCLDRGGCYDYSAKVCRKNEPNAQELCSKSIGR